MISFLWYLAGLLTLPFAAASWALIALRRGEKEEANRRVQDLENLRHLMNSGRLMVKPPKKEKKK